MLHFAFNAVIQKLSKHKWSYQWTITIPSTIPNLKTTLQQFVIRYGHNCVIEKINHTTIIIEFYSREPGKFQSFFSKLTELCKVIEVKISCVQSSWWKKIPSKLRQPYVCGLQRKTRADFQRTISSGRIEVIFPDASKSASSSSPTGEKTEPESKRKCFEVSTSPKFTYETIETPMPQSPGSPLEMNEFQWIPSPSHTGKVFDFKPTEVRTLRQVMKKIQRALAPEIGVYCRNNVSTTREIEYKSRESVFMIKRIIYQDSEGKKVSIQGLSDLKAYLNHYSANNPLSVEWHMEKPQAAEFLYLSSYD